MYDKTARVFSKMISSGKKKWGADEIDTWSKDGTTYQEMPNDSYRSLGPSTKEYSGINQDVAVKGSKTYRRKK